jgi:hypothetical protein
MKEALTFLWLIRFVGLDLGGGRNMALVSASMISLPFSGSNSDSERTYDSKAFTSATNDFFERHSTMLCQGLLWNSHHFPLSFFVFPLSFFVCSLEWLSRGYPSLLCPLFYGLGLPFPCFYYEGFSYLNCCIFCLRFFSILIAYR